MFNIVFILGGLNKSISLRYSWREWWKKILSFPLSWLLLFFLWYRGTSGDLGIERHAFKSQVCSREMQIKIARRFHFTPTRVAKTEDEDECG